MAQVNIKSNEKMEKYSKLTVSYTNVPNTFNVSDNTVSSAGSVTDPSAFEVTILRQMPVQMADLRTSRFIHLLRQMVPEVC